MVLYEACNELFKHNDAFRTLQMVKPNLRRLPFILSTHLSLRYHATDVSGTG
jgi:hypothetical protein